MYYIVFVGGQSDDRSFVGNKHGKLTSLQYAYKHALLADAKLTSENYSASCVIEVDEWSVTDEDYDNGIVAYYRDIAIGQN